MNNLKKITAFILSLTLILIPLNAEKMNNVKAESSSVIPDGEYSAYKAGLNYPNSTEELVLADGDYLTADEIPQLLDPELPQQLLVSAFRRYRR